MPRIERIQRKDRSPRRLPKIGNSERAAVFRENQTVEKLSAAVETELKRLVALEALINGLGPKERKKVIGAAVGILRGSGDVPLYRAIRDAYHDFAAKKRKP